MDIKNFCDEMIIKLKYKEGIGSIIYMGEITSKKET